MSTPARRQTVSEGETSVSSGLFVSDSDPCHANSSAPRPQGIHLQQTKPTKGVVKPSVYIRPPGSSRVMRNLTSLRSNRGTAKRCGTSAAFMRVRPVMASPIGNATRAAAEVSPLAHRTGATYASSESDSDHSSGPSDLNTGEPQASGSRSSASSAPETEAAEESPPSLDPSTPKRKKKRVGWASSGKLQTTIRRSPRPQGTPGTAQMNGKIAAKNVNVKQKDKKHEKVDGKGERGKTRVESEEKNGEVNEKDKKYGMAKAKGQTGRQTAEGEREKVRKSSQTSIPPTKTKKGNESKTRYLSPAESPTEIEDTRVWEVEEILDSCIEAGTLKLFFLIKWKGFPHAENTWEPRMNLFNCRRVLEAYEGNKGRGQAKNK